MNTSTHAAVVGPALAIGLAVLSYLVFHSWTASVAFACIGHLSMMPFAKLPVEIYEFRHKDEETQNIEDRENDLKNRWETSS